MAADAIPVRAFNEQALDCGAMWSSHPNSWQAIRKFQQRF